MSDQPKVIDEGDNAREHIPRSSEAGSVDSALGMFLRGHADRWASLAGGDLDPPTIFFPTR